MDVGVDVSKTVYPIVIDFYDAFLIMGLGPNFHLDDVVILEGVNHNGYFSQTQVLNGITEFLNKVIK